MKRALLLLGLCLMLCVPFAHGQRKPKAPPAVSAILLVEEDKNGRDQIVRCVLSNMSNGPVVAHVGYDGRTNQLLGQGSTHRHVVRLYTRKPDDLKRIVVKAGESKALFELSLNEVLLSKLSEQESPRGRPVEPLRPKWNWDWSARPKGPASPFHRSARETGLLPETKIWAATMIEGAPVASAKVTLKLKIDVVERKSKK